MIDRPETVAALRIRAPSPFGSVPRRVLLLSLLALAVPVAATVAFRDGLGVLESLLWLLALVPAFVLGYYRGWRGAAVAIAAGLAALAIAHAAALGLGRALPEPSAAAPLLAIYLAVGLGIGWTTELLHRHFEQAQESDIDVTFLVAADGTVQHASPSVRRVLAYQPSTLKGMPLEQLLDPQSPRDWLSNPDRIGEAETLELRMRHGQGGWRVLDTVLSDRRHDRDRAGLLLKARDVTDQRNAEEQSRRLYRMKAVGELAGALAHDFNNVLTTIQGNADLLREDLSGDPTSEAGLAEIQRAAGRASRFVELLLAFTRQQILRPKALDLGAFLQEMKGRFAELLGDGIDVELRLADNVPQVFFDPGRLQRILLVLAARAHAHMPNGGRFTIATGAHEITAADIVQFPYPVNTGEYVVLSVSDTGPPLSEAEQSTIFEPFAVSIGEDATGLELSSVYGTIKQSGGYVWLDGDAEAGTTFKIYLRPIDTEQEAVAALPRSEGGGRTILVVEDDPAVRVVLRETLLRHGFLVLEAKDGSEALEIVRQAGSRPDALVTDLMMPITGGRELVTLLKQQYGAFPVLYISGYTEEAGMSESVLEPGAILLTKPFSMQRLVEALRHVLDGVPVE